MRSLLLLFVLPLLVGRGGGGGSGTSSSPLSALSFTEDGLLDFLGTHDEYLEAHPLPEREAKSKY